MKGNARFIANSAILGSLALVILYLSGILPVANIALCAAAGCVGFAAIWRVGLSSGWAVYVVCSVVGILIFPDKGSVLMYIVLFGNYPMVKTLIERLKNPVACWILKIIITSVLLVIVWYAFFPLIAGFVPDWMTQNMLYILLGGLVIFVIYDLAVSGIERVYRRRIGR